MKSIQKVVKYLLTGSSFLQCFIPQTRESSSSDAKSDLTDVFILGNYSLYPKSVIRCRPIGVLSTEDQGGVDSKIIAVPLTKIDPTFSTVKDIDDVPEYLKMQLKHFIEHHKDLEEKKRKICEDNRLGRKRCCKTEDYRSNIKVQGIDG